MEGLKVGQVAKQAGVNLQTIHYYERRGLLPKPPRTGSNYRAYPTDAVLLVRFIKSAQELGFTLKEIKELIALRDGRSRSRTHLHLYEKSPSLRSLYPFPHYTKKVVGRCEAVFDGFKRLPLSVSVFSMAGRLGIEPRLDYILCF